MISWVSALVKVRWQGICSWLDRGGPKREWRRRLVAGLNFERGVVDCATVQPGAGAGLQPADSKSERRQMLAEAHRGKIAGASRRIILQSDMDQTL